MRTLVLLNPEASKARKHLTRVKGRLVDHVRLVDGEVRVGRSWKETRDHAARAEGEGFDIVVAAGGDGTVNAVVDGLLNATEPEGNPDGGVRRGVDSRPSLAVIPLGTGNDLARSLGVPPDLDEGLRSLEKCDTRPMDVIAVEMGGERRVAANVSAGGFSGRVDEQLSDETKELWGPLAYLKTAVEELPEVDHFRATLRMADGGEEVERSLDVVNVAVANGRWAAGGIQVAPGALLGDGLMDVVVLQAAPVARMGVAAAVVAAGEPLEHELVETFRARRLSIDSDPPMPFNVDGELMGADPIEFRVIPGALRVVIGTEGSPAFSPEVEPGEDETDPNEADIELDGFDDTRDEERGGP